jgi:hypothetical protein
MQPRGSSPFVRTLRRVLAVIEFAIAGVFLLLGVGGVTTSPHERIGGDGIGTGIWIAMGVPLLLSSGAVMVSAYTAWRGGRWWWAWQAALPAFWVAVLVVLGMATD